MMILEWLFKPCIEVYNGNWGTSNVNHLWIIWINILQKSIEILDRKNEKNRKGKS